MGDLIREVVYRFGFRLATERPAQPEYNGTNAAPPPYEYLHEYPTTPTPTNTMAAPAPPAAPIPPADCTTYPPSLSSVRIETSDFKFSDGHPVFMKKWLPPPDQATLAKLVFVHGYDDHCDRYYELFPRLAHRGIAVTSWDQRGWGRSAKTTKDWGITGPTEVVISDLVEVVKSAADEEPREAKLFLMGHSMGGAEVLTFASSTQPAHTELLRTTVHGILLDSPHIALSPEQENPKIKIILGRLAARLLPNFQLRHKMPASTITRDPAVQKSMDSDPLLRATGTLQGMSGLLDRALFLHEGKVHLSPEVKSLWLAHGSGDKSTDYNASKAWFERECGQRAKNGEDLAMKTYEGWSHTLHCDLPDNRHIFANDSADWILARVGQAGEAHVGVVPAAAGMPAAAVEIGGESAVNAVAKEIAAEEGQKVERVESKGESKL